MKLRICGRRGRSRQRTFAQPCEGKQEGRRRCGNRRRQGGAWEEVGAERNACDILCAYAGSQTLLHPTRGNRIARGKTLNLSLVERILTLRFRLGSCRGIAYNAIFRLWSRWDFRFDETSGCVDLPASSLPALVRGWWSSRFMVASIKPAWRPSSRSSSAAWKRGSLPWPLSRGGRTFRRLRREHALRRSSESS